MCWTLTEFGLEVLHPRKQTLLLAFPSVYLHLGGQNHKRSDILSVSTHKFEEGKGVQWLEINDFLVTSYWLFTCRTTFQPWPHSFHKGRFLKLGLSQIPTNIGLFANAWPAQSLLSSPMC